MFTVQANTPQYERAGHLIIRLLYGQYQEVRGARTTYQAESRWTGSGCDIMEVRIPEALCTSRTLRPTVEVCEARPPPPISPLGTPSTPSGSHTSMQRSLGLDTLDGC
jgi:hypothetical protein